MNTTEFQRGTGCRFKLADVICPDHQQMLAQVTAHLEVTGRVVFLSDGGERKGCFAIIEVDGIETPLIVPVERLQCESVNQEPIHREAPAASNDLSI